MIIKLFSEAPEKPWSFFFFFLDHKRLEKSLFPFLAVSIYGEKSVKKCFLTSINTIKFQNIFITPKCNLDPVTEPLHSLLCSVPKNFWSIFYLYGLAYSGRFF